MKAFESLDPTGRDALARDLEKLLEDWNTSGDETLVVPSYYLEVVAVQEVNRSNERNESTGR